MDATAESTTIEREIAIAASRETVWEFLVDPDKAILWMGERATFDVRGGGELRNACGRLRVEVAMHVVEGHDRLAFDAPELGDRRSQTLGHEVAPRLLGLPDVDNAHAGSVEPRDVEDAVSRGPAFPIDR